AGTTCAEVSNYWGKPAPRLRGITDADLVTIDHMRGVEVAMVAGPGGCPTDAELTAWIHEVLSEEKMKLTVAKKPGALADIGITRPEGAVCGSFPVVQWDGAGHGKFTVGPLAISDMYLGKLLECPPVGHGPCRP